MMPISFVSVIPESMDDPVVCKTRLTTSESAPEWAASCAKAIMKWDVNSTEIPMLMIKLTSDTAFNSMDNTYIPAIMCNRDDAIVTMNTKWLDQVFKTREAVRMTTTVRREDDKWTAVSCHVLREGIRIGVL